MTLVKEINKGSSTITSALFLEAVSRPQALGGHSYEGHCNLAELKRLEKQMWLRLAQR